MSGKDASTIDSTHFLNSSVKDTVYLKNDSAIVPQDIYLNLDSIKVGDPFTDKAGSYGYYRLLFTLSEETQSFYVDKIQIVGDGILKFKRRFQIAPSVFGLDHEYASIVLIKWQSPEVIEINVVGKRMKLALTKMKSAEIR